MQALRIDQIPPILAGGRVSDPLVGHAQNTNVVKFNDRSRIYAKILERLPETFFPPRTYLRFADADGLQDNGTLRNTFNGRNSINSGGNPIVDWGTGEWPSPLDSYVNPLVRWTDDDTVNATSIVSGQQYQIKTPGTTDFTAFGADDSAVGTIFTATVDGDGASGDGVVYDGVYTADQLVVGLIYEIKTPGTTDFTSLGADDNNVGTKFIASGAGDGTGVVYRTKGARHGDVAMCRVVFGGVETVYMYVSVYDYNNSGSNRLVRGESTDGSTFGNWNEVRFEGGNFGSTPADVVQFVDDGPLYMVCGEDAGVGRGFQKQLRTAEDGDSDWSRIDTIIELSSDPSDPNYWGMPVGRMFVDGDYVYLSAPASRISADWPECNLLYRRLISDIDSPGLWEEWQGGASVIRGPQMGGVWNIDYILMSSGIRFGVMNEWGARDYDNINTDISNTFRDTTPYFRQDRPGGGFKHTGLVQATNTIALTDWDYWPFQDGDTIRLRSQDGKYLRCGSSFGDTVSFTHDVSDTGTMWVVEKQSKFWMFKLANNPSVSLSTGGSGNYANRRAIGIPFEVRVQSQTDKTQNLEHHFQVVLHGDNNPTDCTLVNRNSSMAVTSDSSQQPAHFGRNDQKFKIEVVV